MGVLPAQSLDHAAASHAEDKQWEQKPHRETMEPFSHQTQAVPTRALHPRWSSIHTKTQGFFGRLGATTEKSTDYLQLIGFVKFPVGTPLYSSSFLFFNSLNLLLVLHGKAARKLQDAAQAPRRPRDLGSEVE